MSKIVLTEGLTDIVMGLTYETLSQVDISDIKNLDMVLENMLDLVCSMNKKNSRQQKMWKKNKWIKSGKR